MFGRRGNDTGNKPESGTRPAMPKPASSAAMPAPTQPVVQPSRMQAAVPSTPAKSHTQTGTQGREKTESYYDTKSQVFSALIDTIDLSQLSRMAPDAAREEIRDIVNDIIAIKNFVMSIAEQEELLDDICNDVLGYGPLEPLLSRDDIADIMVNGSRRTYIEVDGLLQETGIRFRDNQQLLNICQRIVSQVGRREDRKSVV